MLETPYVTQYLTEHFGEADYPTIEGYERVGGYRAARKALTEMSPDEVIELVKTAGLQGRGGAGFSAGLKWSFMPKDADRPKYLVCNADESEPGSFKDRILLERGTHQMIEGILIAAWATGASATFIYIRGEYAYPAGQVERAIAEAYAKGYLGENVMGTGFRHDVHVTRGAGCLHLRGRDRTARIARGQEGSAAQEAALPRAVRRIRDAYDSQQRGDLFPRSAHRRKRRQLVSLVRNREEPRHDDLRRVGSCRPPRPLRVAARNAAIRKSSLSTRAAFPVGAG